MITLAADIGGTHARLALFEAGPPRRLIGRHDYRSRDYDRLEPIVRDFLAPTDVVPDRACLAIAGPIVDGICETSNLPWTIEVAEFGERVGLPGLRFINDFEAVGWAIGELGPQDTVTLREGRPAAHGHIAMIGSGTGLGCGFMTWDGARYRIHSSEGGHVDYGPTSPLEVELYSHLAGRFGRVSYERVASGPGLVNVYGFLVESRRYPESPDVRRAMDDPDADPARAISSSALAGTDTGCVQALDLFCAALGRFAGNVTLTIKATGGVYLAGGIAPAIIDKLRDGTFERAFLDKGRVSEIVKAAPVRVIVREGVGLLGAAVAAETLGPATH